MLKSKVNVDALYASVCANNKTVEQVLKELNYPTDALRNMYSFQQVLELDTIEELLKSQNLTMPVVKYQ